MLEYGTNEKDLGAIAIACRNRANAEPATRRCTSVHLTMDDYLAARMISRPLRLFDFCLETDGACAVVVTSTERAKDAPEPAGADPGRRPGHACRRRSRASSSRSCCATTITTLPAKPTADTLYRRAGLGPADIDVAQLYDCFTITVLLQLEDYGFCAKGEGGRVRRRAGRSSSAAACRSTPAAATCRRATSTA